VRPSRRPLAVLALAAAAAAAPAWAPAQEDEGGAPPDYALPSGLPGPGALEEPLRSAVARAVRDALRPRSPWAARDGARVIAGVGPAAAAPAVEALRRADWFGRATLVRALGAMDAPALVPLLLQAAHDPAWAVREAAAEGLSRAADAESPPVLADLLRDGAWRVRRAAVEALRARALRGTAGREAAGGALLPLASDPDRDVRLAAWLALADLREPRARGVLRDALRDLADRVRSTGPEDPPDPVYPFAVRILRGFAGAGPGDGETLDALLGIGEEPEHPLAGEALREWARAAGPEAARTPDALGRLVAVFVHPAADLDSRNAAEQALLASGPGAADALLAAVAPPASATRQPPAYAAVRHALDLVVRLRGDAAPEVLAALIRDPALTPTVRTLAADFGRRAAARALGPVFREVLARGEGNPGLDAMLVRGVAESGLEDAGEIVRRALVLTGPDSPARPVRAAAAEAIASRPAFRDLATLVRAAAAETDPDVLDRFLPALAAAAGDDAPAALAARLRDARAQVRRSAARALAGVPGPGSVRALLEAFAREDGADTRLPWHGDGEPDASARRQIEEARRAIATGVREAIVGCLRAAAGRDAAPLLLPLLVDGDPDVRKAAADNLAALGDEAAAPGLAERAAAEPEGTVRARMLVALAAIGGPAADGAFEALLAGDDAGLRMAALEALGEEEGRIRARAPAGVLRSATRPDGGPLERVAALRALGRERDPARTPLLLDLLAKAPDGEERRAILLSLGRTGDPAAAAPVAALLPRGDPARLDPDGLETAATALETLGELRAAEAVPPLAATLERALPAALSGSGGRDAAASRQLAVLAVRALGRSRVPAAREVLVRAAFHPGFSRAAEAATADPLRLRPPRSEDERWIPALPEELRVLGTELAAALARWSDTDLLPSVRRRLDALREDGSAFAISEEWLSWLALTLGDPRGNRPYRPRWWTKVALFAQVEANAPRATEADLEAAFTAFRNEAALTGDYSAAERSLGRWRDLLRVHDPARAGREGPAIAGLERAVAGGIRLRRGEGDPAALVEAWEESGRDDRVARLGVDVLLDLGKHPAEAVALAERAVKSSPGYSLNLRYLGEARLAAGDAAGAADALEAAMAEHRRHGVEEARTAAWTLFHLGRALARLGEVEDALDALADGARRNDVVLEACLRHRDLAALREGGRLDEALAGAKRLFDE